MVKKETATPKVAEKKKETATPKGFVTVEVLQGIILGRKAGEIFDIDSDLAKAYGPEYLKIVKGGKKTEEETEDEEVSE